MKKLITSIISLIVSITLFGQVSPTGEFESIDMMGLQEMTMEEELQEEIATLRSNYSEEIAVIDFQAYPVSAYYNPDDGINATINMFLQDVEAEHEYYIVFISEHLKGNLIDDMQMKVKLPPGIDGCITNMNAVLSLSQAKMQQKFAEIGNSPMSSHLPKIEGLKELNKGIQSNCMLAGEDLIPMLEELEFEMITIPGIEVIYPSQLSDYGLEPTVGRPDEDKDMCGGVVDYTMGNLRYKVGANINLVNELLADDNILPGETYRILLLTNEDLASISLDTLIEHETDNMECDKVILVVFPGHFQSGEDQVGIRVITGSEDDEEIHYHTFQELENEYAHDGYFKINFRFENHKDQLLGLCSVYSCSQTDYYLGTSGCYLIEDYCEYSMGLAAGIGDGLIETIDMLSVAAQFLSDKIVEYSTNTPTSMAFWTDLVRYAVHKRSIYEAFKYKYNESWKYWKGNIEGIINFAGNIAENIPKILESIKGMLTEWLEDMTFQNGLFEAGYAHGKVIFDILSDILTSGGASVKGMMGIIKKAKEAGENVVKYAMKKLDDITPSRAQLEDLARHFVKRLSAAKWNLINDLLEASYNTIYYLEKWTPAMAYAGINLPGPTPLQKYKNQIEAFILKIKNEHIPPNKGIGHEIQKGNVGVLYHDTKNASKRGAVIIGEKQGEEFIAKLAATLPEGCDDILRELSAEKLLTLADEIAPSGKKLVEEITEAGQLRAWEVALNHGDDIRLNTDFLSTLGNHLDDFPNLKPDLDDVDVFNAYKEIANDVEQSYEILDDVEGNLAVLIAQKTQNSGAPDFWKWIQRGKKFENDLVLPKFKNRSSAEYLQLKSKASTEFGVNLDQYDMYKQVQLKYNGNDYFVADQVYVKWVDVNGTQVVDDIVVIEDKLKSTTRLTTNQNAGKAASSLEVRSVSATSQSPVSGNPLLQNTTINTNDKWLKVYDSENGDVISGINKL